VEKRGFAGARRELWIGALLVAAVAVVFGRCLTHAFIDFDDPGYVFENPFVRKGLTWDGVAWAFTTGAQSTWHPLTWLSHMLDAELFGVGGRILGLPAAGWHHAVNAGLHACAAVLLFAFLREATRALWRSAMVAALFALHPLHVESVAWASERKDVLSALLGFACLLAYVRYARRPSLARYLLVFVLLALGLMAKSMLVTWPFVMLLLDVWPLERWRAEQDAARAPSPSRRSRLVVEKLPLFALSAAACALTYVFERPAMHLTEVVPLGFRLENGLISCLAYFAQMLWPSDLSILYPYPRAIAASRFVEAALFVAALLVLAFGSARRRPWLTVGVLWFLGTLVPVIGLVQIGLHARADRFTYLPLVGLFLAIVWSAADAIERRPGLRPAVPGACAAILLACSALSVRQVERWSDTETLFRHACDVTESNGWAHRILGTALAEEGRHAEAIVEYRAALAVWPEDPIAHNNLGSALQARGDLEDSVREYREAVRIDPRNAMYRRNLSRALAKTGRFGEANRELDEANLLSSSVTPVPPASPIVGVAPGPGR
jgi:tetratricopeptide (TPR) repeat protein